MHHVILMAFLKNIVSIYVVLIVGMVFPVYYPTLSLSPTADQFRFLEGVNTDDSLLEATLPHYARNRDLEGNTVLGSLLFRPFSYFYLGFLHWAFGADYRCFHFFGIMIHGFICIVLFLILKIKISEAFLLSGCTSKLDYILYSHKNQGRSIVG